MLLIIAMAIGAIALTAFYEWYPADRAADELAQAANDSLVWQADTTLRGQD